MGKFVIYLIYAFNIFFILLRNSISLLVYSINVLLLTSPLPKTNLQIRGIGGTVTWISKDIYSKVMGQECRVYTWFEF